MSGNITMRERAAKGLKTCAVAASLIVIVSTGSSWAFSTYDEYQDAPPLKAEKAAYTPQLQNKPSSAVTDSCLPLLKTIRKTSSNLVTDRNQRSAGKVAALGLIFGVQYALTPPGSAPAQKVKLNEKKGTAMNSNRSALAVSAYRACQKQQALAALNNAH